MLEVQERSDGKFNIWAPHQHAAASSWQVIHVADSVEEAEDWIDETKG